MANNEVEENLIGIALKKPRLVENIDFKANYFLNERMQAIATVMCDLPEAKRTLANIWNELDNGYNKQNFPISYHDLVALEGVFINEASFYRDLQALKRAYLERQLQLVMIEYSRDRSEKILTKLSATLDSLNQLNTVDKGQLGPAVTEFLAEVEAKELHLIKTLPKLDKILNGGLTGSKLIALGARPGVGKTAFGLNMVKGILQNNPEVHVDYFSLEMSKLEILKRLLANMTQTAHSKLINPVKAKLELTSLTQAQDQLLASNLRVYDSLRTLSSILAVIQHHASKYPNQYIAFIDYLGLISLDSSKVMDRYLQVSEITRQLKLCTIDYKVPIVMFSQLNRAVESRQSKAPQLSDLRESGSIEQDANLVAFLYRPDQVISKVNLVVRKNREGKLGEVAFTFRGETMTFEWTLCWFSVWIRGDASRFKC